MRESLAPVNGFSAELGSLLFRPRPRRFEDDLLEIIAADYDDREIEPAVFAHQPATDGPAGRRLLGDAHGVREAVPDSAECCEIAAIVQVELGQGEGGFPANELAGGGVDRVPPEAVVVQGFDPIDRHARGAVEADIRG